MNIRRSIIGAVLAGASLVGVASMASSAAHAETPTTATATESEVGTTAQSTRRFWIENLSSETFYVDDAWALKPNDIESVELRGPRSLPRDRHEALLPDDSVPAKVAVRPGEHITVEVVSQSAGHQIVVSLRSFGPSKSVVDLVLGVEFNMRGSKAWSDGLRVEAGGQNITIRNR